MKFRFKLERLLSLIRIKETMKKLEVAAVLRKVQLIKRRQEELRTNIQALLGKALGSNEGANQIDMSMVSFAMKKIELDRAEEVKLEVLLLETNRELKKYKDELVRLSVRRKGLESIRERRMSEFKLQKSREDQKDLDEAYELSRKVA